MLASCQEPPKEATPKARPNVLFIAVDDLRPELGIYGGQALTPNMDALAQEGALFEHHYVQVPTCGASRYALLTGHRPSQPQHLRNDAIEKAFSQPRPDALPETFVHRLKQAGYHTVGIGKISHSADGFVYGYRDSVSSLRELPQSWSELKFDAGPWETGWNAFFAYANGENRQSLNKQVKPYEKAKVEDEGYPDGRIANLALSTLAALKERDTPFFLGVGFFKPHLPFNAPERYWEAYQREAIALAPNTAAPQNRYPGALHKDPYETKNVAPEQRAIVQELLPVFKTGAAPWHRPRPQK
ncbi:sulfatase-like hydrolase/transferase [Maribacter sp. 2307ULW6-5]|uniref:sulfatase-like hydrolase/transferase n=1 Tax=Maribacter sp. 2307ULW6-5 TaxID=3386275 RepID=UPI0039BD7F19